MNSTFRILAGAALLSSATLTAAPAFADGEVNIYSYRQPYLIEPLLDAFTKETGIKTNVVFAAEGLGERIAAEGANSPADVLLTVDIGRLDGAKQLGISQPVVSEIVNANVPAEFRDPEGHWIGLTNRARVIYASKERVDQDSITYEELADPKWKGRLCTRSGQHVYTVGLVASMVAHHGAEETEKWLEGVRDNLARKPAGNDRAQVKAIFAGECDIALGNTYYMGLMQTNEKEPEQQTWADSVRILFPNTDDRGSHVNVAGVILTKNAPNQDNAVKLIEFLSSDEAQQIYAETNHEYPVKPGVAVSERVASWGEFKKDTLSLADIAKNRKTASELIDEVGFDDGPAS
ncbi:MULTISPECIES: Fe(3+) ABC transporter substrate-binding protein [Stappiaceae]|jgi:iron(III) transport system substrate-binding protein|uniref:Iron uptake protein A1 n=1 Tax=Roseibium aggregatum TaxID=187304 RepID=A0A0M6Y4Z3_9HYPH|nr:MULTISPECIES: Fe(3+) ABC transporter substrate-binding protein [Stappiaceae]AMN54901.1 iron ABC transporter substrate-binding protein [Labrenzia sp. CP4]MBO9461248.1 Fe(3+) ABC transporter substrate-binding protein [Labrenzia sp. R5_0]MEC9420070.1 Fe(3+) ABC transporter substrate-binding protein [Pseudomonadota bacterium]CTQ44774.1 Iron uptake protein A1 precursor [Roseibium aggregatum]